MARSKPLQSFVIATLLLPATTLFAQLPSTQLSSVFPPGGKFGTTTDVQVAGADQIDQRVVGAVGLDLIPLDLRLGCR